MRFWRSEGRRSTGLYREGGPVAETSESPGVELWKVLDLAAGWIQHAENKAAALLLGNGAMLAAYPALGEGAVGDSFLVAVIDVVPMVILVVAFVMSAWVFAPIRSVESVPGSDPTPNLLFFSHVAGSFGSGRAYGAAMESLSELRGGLNRHLAAQVWAMSVVATRKMDRASQALLVTLLGLVFALALLARSRI